MGTNHRAQVERVALLDGLGANLGVSKERVVDAVLQQRTARTRADLALVEREHRETLERLVVEVIVGVSNVGEEDVRALAAEFQRHRNDVLRGVLHDQTTSRGLARECDLRDTRT